MTPPENHAHTRARSATLHSGVRLVVEPIAGVRSVGLTWLVPGGAAHDPADRQGRAALWSELLLRGAGTLDSRDQADAFDRLGVARSVDAGALYMRFQLTALGERLHDALPLLVDMLRRPRIDHDAVEPARELALASLESLKDDPGERCVLSARERHLPEPLNRSGLGNAEGLAALTRDELFEGWHATARPGGSILALAGAVDFDRLAPALDALLSGWTGATPEPPRGPAPPGGYLHTQDQTKQVQIVVLHDAPPESSPDAPLERILLAVLSGSMSGRLFTEVREKRGLCYSVHARYSGERDYGIVAADVGTTPERAAESLDVLLAELRRVHTPDGAVTPEEFRRAVTGLKSRLIFSGESSSARAAALASDIHRLGRPRSLEQHAAEIDAVTLDALNAYLRRRSMGRVTVHSLGAARLAPAL